jgi:transglutaminase-like putative cysteine protease
VPRLYLALWRDMGTLLSRTYGWLVGLLSGGGAFDLVGTALVWGLIVWLCNLWMGWWVRRRHNPLVGVLPGGLLLSFVLSYTGSNPYVFLPILGATLVLIALVKHLAREDRWSVAGIDFSQGLWSDIAMVATGISIALVLAAAIAPSISAQKIADWVNELTDTEEERRTEEVAEGLGLQQKPEPRDPRPLQSVRSTGLPRRHLIGSGPELTRRVVMVIETGELPPIPESLMDLDPPRHYWRSITYDRYFGRGWATSNTEEITYEPGEELSVSGVTTPIHTLRQSVRLIGPDIGGMVHVDGTLLSMDQEFTVAWRSQDELFAATTAARAYRADSIVNRATAKNLREAPVDYPDWLLQRYLQLPENLPDRVTALARDLTATEPTPYDRAVAIEAYLRQFPYTLDVPTPGIDNDIADYFLFELQEGYCDYYATSMVVLARSAGIPARLVVGYINGTYDPMNARYVVTEADAHAWPEIYFPGYGWIEFEPTGGRPPIERDSGDEETPIWPEGESPPEPLVPPKESSGPRIVLGLWLLAGVGGVALVVAVLTGVDSARLLWDSPEGMAGRFYRRLKAYADRLRIRNRRGDTPYELAHAFEGRIKEIAEGHGFAGIEFLEPAAEEVQTLMDLYVRVWYSPEADLSREARRRAVWTWWRLRWRLWLAWLWRRTREKESGTPADLAAQRSAA